jgi:hypothetical protein|tara:strand:- start:402 stop:524 length:123 start_codon:yes stop_codon:yes gene_type:complete
VVRDDGAWFVSRLRGVPSINLGVDTGLQRCVELESLSVLF